MKKFKYLGLSLLISLGFMVVANTEVKANEFSNPETEAMIEGKINEFTEDENFVVFMSKPENRGKFEAKKAEISAEFNRLKTDLSRRTETLVTYVNSEEFKTFDTSSLQNLLNDGANKLNNVYSITTGTKVAKFDENGNVIIEDSQPIKFNTESKTINTIFYLISNGIKVILGVMTAIIIFNIAKLSMVWLPKIDVSGMSQLDKTSKKDKKDKKKDKKRERVYSNIGGLFTKKDTLAFNSSRKKSKK